MHAFFLSRTRKEAELQALHGKLKPHGGIAKVLQSVKAGSGSHGMFFSFVSGCCNKALRELKRREGALGAYCYKAIVI